MEKFEEAIYFPSALVIVAKSFEKGFLRSFISKYVFPVIVNQILNIQIYPIRVKVSVT